MGSPTASGEPGTGDPSSVLLPTSTVHRARSPR